MLICIGLLHIVFLETVVLDHLKEPLLSRPPLYCRLHGCIQSAASRLQECGAKRSTKRVEVLIHLIPKEPSIVPGIYVKLFLFVNEMLWFQFAVVSV